MLDRGSVKAVAAHLTAGTAKATKDATRAATAKPAVRKTAARTSVARSAPRKPRAGGGSAGDLQAQIRQRAYELWEHDGRPEGYDHAHWTQAERELGAPQAAR